VKEVIVSIETGIPQSFQLMGHKITVKVIPKARWRRKSCVGVWIPDKLRIELLDDGEASVVQHTFCHELTHAMLDMISHELSRDEQFVDQLGALLQQALTTFEIKSARTKNK